MNTLNIVTAQDQTAFDMLKSYMLNEHGTIDWTFCPTGNKKQDAIKMLGMIEGIYMVWMMNCKKSNTFEPDDGNINLKNVAEWFLSLSDNNDMY